MVYGEARTGAYFGWMGLNVLITDAQGSVIRSMDSSSFGSVSDTRYTPWGQVRQTTGSSTTSFGYTGQRSEAGFGLIYLNARWYDPVQGRFTQPDSIVPNPANPVDWDRFGYGLNNPINRVDPSGHDSCMASNGGQCFVGSDGTYYKNGFKPSDSKPPFTRQPNFPIPNLPSLPNMWIVPQRATQSFELQCDSSNVCISKWEKPSNWDTNPQHPDYYVLTINAGGLIGGTITISADRYNSFYIGAGGNIGKSMTVVSGSLTGGYIGSPSDTIIPDQANTESFLTGWTVSAGGGVFGGGAIIWSPEAGKYVPNTAIESGGYFPSVGISATRSILISRLSPAVR